MFERIDIVEQMCEYGLQLLEHLFEGVVMRSKSIVQVQAKTVSERYRNSFLRAHHRVLAVVVTISACFALCCVTAGARESDAVVEAASSEVVLNENRANTPSLLCLPVRYAYGGTTKA